MSRPADPEHTEDRPTGVTVATRWGRLTDAERRTFLLAAGVKIYAASAADAPWTLDVAEPNVLRVA